MIDVVKIDSQFSVIFSETDNNSDVLDAKFIICDFSPNRNDVSLNRSTIENWLKTIEIKPLVGKVIKKLSGVTDFSGHNVKIVEKIDANGKKYKDIEFDTSAFGSFYGTSIETIDGIEYIVASAKIWKRFTQAYEVIKRRIDSDIGIKTSWEIQVVESHKETIDGKEIKVIDEGIFIGHALLGEGVEPAYPSSGLLEVATSNETDDELASALIVDIQNTQEFSNTKEDIVKMPEDIKVTSALTARDLHQKVREALNPKGWNSNPYFSVWEIYPEEHKILAYDIDRSSEDDYLVFTYTVVDEVVTMGESTATKLSKLIAEKANVQINVDLNDTARLLSEKETEITSLKSDREKLALDLSEKNEALITASEKITQLEQSISELTPFKEKVEQLENAERDKEIAEKKEELRKIAAKGGFISQEEIDTSEEIKSMIETLDETAIKAIIAERFMKKLDEQEHELPVETSEVSTKVTSNVKTIINNDEDIMDHKAVMSTFLFKN